MEHRDESFRWNRPGTVDGRDRCRDQYGCVLGRKAWRPQEVQEWAVVFRPDHDVHWQSVGPHCQCSAWLGDALSSVFLKEKCKVGCDDAGGGAVSVRHERCGEQSGDDGTEDQGVRETRHHRDPPNRRWTDEDAPHHELAQVGDLFKKSRTR